MLKRPSTIAVFAALLLALILFKLPASATVRLKSAISGLFIPLFGLSASARQTLENTGNAITSRPVLIRQRDELARVNEQLRLQTLQGEEALRENAQLRQLIGWQKQTPWKTKLARVIARDPANWWRSIQIDIGSRDGVQINQPVVTADGLIGRVSALGETRSTVVLVGDPALRISAVIQETRETGVILSASSGALESDMVDLGYLSRTSNAKPGQTVVTSGDGGVFPKGIPIGRIADTSSVRFGIATEARVRLAANISRLEEV
ncbi:MAG: rod shape-determining protein MreC, partial [Opitutaceae bacterium]|nr:rod shape-determining protein MreC [Verrucomicrobiales bacterium]